MKDKRKYLVLLIIPILLLLFFLSNLNSEHDEIIEEEIETEKSLSIDIKGAVKNPGVYELKDGSVVKDQTTPNMIQRISGIFERNPLISKEI